MANPEGAIFWDFLDSEKIALIPALASYILG
jgi:hypothetical protein